jgi:hypothetical protein
VLDSETQAAIFQRLKEEFVDRSPFCQPTPYPASPPVSTESDHGARPLVEQGDLAKLQRPGSALAPLMAAVRAVLALPTGH